MIKKQKKQEGLLTFTPSVSEWINKTNAIGLYVKRGTIWIYSESMERS